MNEAARNYYNVQRNLRAIAEDYFTYLKKDRLLSPTEQQALVARDAALFFGLASIYRDSTTKTYLEELLRTEHVDPAEKLSQKEKTSRVPRVKTSKNGAFDSKRSTNTHKPMVTQNFKPLADVCEELRITTSVLDYVAANAQITLEQRMVDENLVYGVTDNQYKLIRDCLRKLRS